MGTVVPVVHAPSGIAGGIQMLPLVAIPETDNLSAAMKVVLSALDSGDATILLRSYSSDSDAVAETSQQRHIGSAAFAMGWNTTANAWQRVRVQGDGADGVGVSTIGHVSAVAHGAVFNGASWDRRRSASAANLAAFAGLGSALSVTPGEWAIQHQPAAATQATITRAAGGAGVRHVCRSITATLLATAAQAAIVVNLRDGASGAGTILWSAGFLLGAGTSDRIALTGLNIVGSDNTAMTLEFAAAPAATNLAQVAMTGFDAS